MPWRRSLILLSLCFVGQAAQVVDISLSTYLVKITRDLGQEWRPKETACVYRNQTEIGCGHIIKATEHETILRLTRRTDSPRIGDGVFRSARELASVESLAPAISSELNPYAIAGTVSVDVSVHYLFPGIRFENAINRRLAIGVQAAYFKTVVGTTSVSIPSALLTAAYFSRDPFQGLWAQAAIGAYLFSATSRGSTESATAPAVMGTLGWRFQWKSGIFLDAAGGGQYIGLPTFTSISFPFGQFQPVVVADFGIRF